ncbi:hypothetical protein MW887_006155 [Aspergillus wentii]|nr:hypothetical protein MW887_006155 [Aspergillus wentii]
MKAWLYSSTTGGLETNLTMTSSARTPGPLQQNQLLIQVISASLNPADYKLPELMGIAAKAIIGLPASPGMDFCGRVVTTGSGVTEYTPGAVVYGSLAGAVQFGSLGEYIVANVDKVAALPEGVEVDHAATVGVTGQTAYQSLAGYVVPGDKVFINGGSGGCGIYGIQIAKAMGCYVTTTCSGRNVALCKELGADEVIDYTAQDVVGVLKGGGRVYSHVVDNVGVPENLYRECDSFLMPGKVFVQIGVVSLGTAVERFVRPGFLGGGKRKYDYVVCKNEREHLVKIGEWIREGKIKVVVDSAWAFEDAVKGYEKVRSGRARGKVVVHVTEA